LTVWLGDYDIVGSHIKTIQLSQTVDL